MNKLIEQQCSMKKIYNSLIIFDFFKEKFERDQFLIEYSADVTKKYSKRCKDLNLFNKDLKLSLFLKQIIDICSFLDEFNAFRSLAKRNEKIKNICKKVKPAIDRIEEVKGLRTYRNSLAAHNFRSDKNKEDVVLLSDFTKHPENPNSFAEVFFLTALCTTIIEAINTEFINELELAKQDYWSRLEEDKDDPLRGVKNLREAYDYVEEYRIKLGMQPNFLASEIEEFNMALKKLNWDMIPKGFELSKDKTSSNWCEVLDKYLRMRGYKDINYIQGNKGRFTDFWLELYGHAVTVSERVYVLKPDNIRNKYNSTIIFIPSCKEEDIKNSQIAYNEIMKVVAP